MIKKSLSLFLTVALLASCVGLSSCNNNKPQESTQSSENVSNTSSKESVVVEKKDEEGGLTAEQKKELSEKIQKYGEQAVFAPSLSTIDAPSITEDKNILLVTDSIHNEYNGLISETFATAAKKAGFVNVVSYDTDGTDSIYLEALDTVLGNYDCVALFGNIDKDKLGSEIEVIQSNGVPVFSAGNVQVGEKEHYVDGSMGWDYEQAGSLLLDWLSYNQNGKVKALVVTCTDDNTSNSVYRGFAKDFEKYVKQGYCTEVKARSSEIGSDLKSKIETALKKDSNINCVVVMNQDLISDTVYALEAGNYRDSVTFVSVGGSAESFAEVENGNIDMIVAQSYEAVAYGFVDYCMRGLSSTVPESENLPMRIFTAETIAAEKTEPSEDLEDIEGDVEYYRYAFESIFSEGYPTLWSLE